jgi:hypothetical protein
MTKQNWEEEWDEIYSKSKFHTVEIQNAWADLMIAQKAFIHQNRKELVEEILADIPLAKGGMYDHLSMTAIKQKLRDKYLNN